jgi:hypothetical protein
LSAVDHSMIAWKVMGHRVATGLDALGDRDLALAAEQLHRPHLAQVHAHRVISAVHRLLLLFGSDVERIRTVIGGVDIVGGLFLGPFLVVLDDVDAHFGNRGHHVLDLLGRHLVLRQRLVQLVIGDVTALLGAREQLLDRGFVEVDQRGIGAVGLGVFRFLGQFAYFLSPVPPRPASKAAENLLCYQTAGVRFKYFASTGRSFRAG